MSVPVAGEDARDTSDLARLWEPDPRTLSFLPSGLGIGVQMTPASAADYWCRIAEGLALHEDVAPPTRTAFEMLASTLPYGVLQYEIFTLVNDRALFLPEQALRDRFVELHRHGGVVVLGHDGVERRVPISSYDDVHALFAPIKGRPKLVVTVPDGTTEAVSFNAALGSLLRWARRAGLLEGQRAKAIEDATQGIRNSVAHDGGGHLLGPHHAVLSLRDAAEIINHLWGHDTPGGRLYPAPVERRTVVVAWTKSGTHAATWGLAENLFDRADWDEYDAFALVQAAEWQSSDVADFDAWYDTTPRPIDYVWGPGSQHEVRAWFEQHGTLMDTVGTGGRRFLIRVDEEHIWFPMRPQVAAALADDQRGGQWYLIGADDPDSAVVHVRNAEFEGGACDLGRICAACGARNLGEGDLSSLIHKAASGGDSTIVVPPDFFVPGPRGGTRWVARPGRGPRSSGRWSD